MWFLQEHGGGFDGADFGDWGERLVVSGWWVDGRGVGVEEGRRE